MRETMSEPFEIVCYLRRHQPCSSLQSDPHGWRSHSVCPPSWPCHTKCLIGQLSLSAVWHNSKWKIRNSIFKRRKYSPNMITNDYLISYNRLRNTIGNLAPGQRTTLSHFPRTVCVAEPASAVHFFLVPKPLYNYYKTPEALWTSCLKLPCYHHGPVNWTTMDRELQATIQATIRVALRWDFLMLNHERRVFGKANTVRTVFIRTAVVLSHVIFYNSIACSGYKWTMRNSKKP